MLLDRAIDEFGIVNVVCLNAGVTGSSRSIVGFGQTGLGLDTGNTS